MKRFNIELLKLARECRFTTQEEMASILSMEQGTLSKIEKGLLNVDDMLAEKISFALDFPIDFFYQEIKVIPTEGHYRRKSSIPVKKMKQYIAKMTLAEWHFLKLMDEIELPDVNLPTWDVDIDGDPGLCAKHVREYWKIPKGRLLNVSKVIEDNGIIIIPLDLGEMEGFSSFINGCIPVIYINKNLSADRFRLTLVHELGHLILHFGKKVSAERDLEKEAYRFGIEFLVPQSNIQPYFTKLSIDKLADLKLYWNVSMQALLVYAKHLGMITDSQNKYLWMQMSSLGYRKQEPVSIPKEKPELLNEIINSYLKDLGYTKKELAQILYITENELDYSYFGRLKILRRLPI